MEAFLLHGATGLLLTELTVPDPKSGQALVAIRRAGNYRSDMHCQGHFRIGQLVTVDPSVPRGICSQAQAPSQMQGRHDKAIRQTSRHADGGTCAVGKRRAAARAKLCQPFRTVHRETPKAAATPADFCPALRRATICSRI